MKIVKARFEHPAHQFSLYRIYHPSGQPVPVVHHPRSNEFLPYI